MSLPPHQDSRSHLLQALAHKIREARKARGLSLQATADAAGFSRRFLVEIEAGRANPSISKLAALAGALGVPLRELCDLTGAAAPRRRIALIGLRGAGKSTVGRLLAAALEVPFVELDEVIEEAAGLRVPEIFDLHGAAAYRRFEAEALETWLSHTGSGVLAVPGGAVTSAATFERLLQTCRTVWLQATPEDHWERVVRQGDTRPMRNQPEAMERLRSLLKERAPLYRRADLHLQTSGSTPEACVRRLLGALQDGAAA